jgi:aldose 1-epimerase
MPVNHGLGKGQIPHHLHGLAFDKEPTIETSNSADGAQIKAHFAPGFNGDYWTGRLSLDITHTLSNGIYEFKMRTTNRGSGLVPVGAGAHPYFLAPSGDPSAVRLYVPAKSLVEIDNYKNVLPTGRIVKIKKRSKFDFNDPKGRPIAGQYYDNLWVDLDLNEQGYAFADFIDEKEGIRTRMTATTKNIIGIQVYAPKPGTNPALGVFAAIEFVTSLPDARDELWKDNDTGMVVLKPGESMDYGYTIEVFPI